MPTAKDKLRDDPAEMARRQQDFAEAVADWFWEMDKEFRVVYLSEHFSEKVGIDPQTILGKRLDEIVGKAEVQSDPGKWANLKEDLRGHHPFRDFEIPITDEKGGILEQRLSGLPVFDDSCGFAGFRGAGIDVTAHKLAAQNLQMTLTELQERVEAKTQDLEDANSQLQNEIAIRKDAEQDITASKERFRGFAETASDWLWETDQASRFTYLSPSFFKRTDFDETDIIGKTRSELAGEIELLKDPEKWQAHFDDIEAKRPFQDFEYSYLDRQGERTHVTISGYPVFDVDGDFEGYRGTSSNITARKVAERTLLENELRLRTIFDTAAAGVISIDISGKIETFNAAAETIFGYDADEVVGKQVEMLMTDADSGNHHQYVRDYLDTKKATVVGAVREVVGLRKDGSTFPMQLGVSEYTLNGARAFTGFVIDISAQKQAEGELRRRNQLLAFNDRISTAANEAQSVESICQVVVDEICQATGWAVGHTWLGTRDNPQIIQSSEIWHLDDPNAFSEFRDIAERITLRPDTGLAGRVLTNGEIQWNLKIDEDFVYARSAAAAKAELKTGAAVPLMAGQDIIGVAEFFAREPMEEDDVLKTVISTACSQLARVVERKWAEQALAAKEAQLRFVLDNVPGGILLANKDDRIVFSNQQYLDMFQFPKHIVAPGQPLSGIIKVAAERGDYGPGDPHQIYEERIKAVRARQPASLELHMHTGEILLLQSAPVIDGYTVFVFTDITEHQRAEERLKLAIDTMSEGFTIYDADDKLVMFNEKMREMYPLIADVYEIGITFEEILRASIERGQFGGPEFSSEEWVSMVMEKRRHGSGPVYYDLPTGQRVRTVEVRLPDGSTVGIRTDVTDMLHAEQALRESDAQLRRIMDSSPVGISIVSASRDKRFYVNSALVKMFGTDSEEDLFNRSLADSFVDPTDLDRLRKPEDGKIVSEVEMLRKRIDGTTWWCLTNRQHIDFKSEKAIIVWHYDITARKEAESALQESELQFRQTFEHAPIGMALVTIEGERFELNQAFADFLGYPIEELIDTTTFSTTDSREDINRSVELHQKVIDGEISTYKNERRYQRKDGKIVWAEVTGSLIRNAEDEPLHFVAHTVDITERKRWEEETILNEQRFRSFAEATSDWYWEMDADLRFSFFSERYEEICGIPPEQLLGKTRAETAVSVIDDRDLEQNLADLAAHRPFRNFVHYRTRPDGEIIYLASSGRPIFDAGDNFLGYRGAGVDITEQVLAEQAVAESEQRFQMLAAAASAGVFYTGPNGRCIFVNEAWTEITGVSEDDAYGQRWDASVVARESDAVRTAWTRSIETDTAFDMELQFERPDGSLIWTRVQASPHTNKEGGIRGFLGTAINIEDQKSAEQELLETSARSNAILNNAPAAIYLKDREGRYLHVNDKFLKLFERDLSIIGQTDMEIYPPNISAFLSQHDRQLLDGGEPLEFEQSIAINGQSQTYLTTKFPLFDTSGNPYAVCGIATDISERKHTEAQLMHASKMASIGRMSASITHELSQPLHIVALTVDNEIVSLEEGQSNTQELLKSLATVDDQCRRMAATISHMGVFSRIDEGEGELFAVANAVEGVVTLLDKPFAANNVTFTIDLAANCGHVLGHRTQLEQVLINLSTNAHDAIMEKHGENTADDLGQVIEVACKPREDGQSVEISVADHGVGIPEEAISDIFEPFRTTKDSGEGTGLGLAISLDIVNAMGGTITAENTDVGAKFTIVLPLQLETIPLSAVAEPSRPADASVMPVAREGARLLIVDDEKTAAQHMAKHLRRRGFDVTVAYGGNHALSQFEKEPADLVITDLRMPKGDGAGLIENLRAIAPALPIIIVTGDLNAAEMNNQIAGSGPMAVYKKPLDLPNLLKTVDEFLAPE